MSAYGLGVAAGYVVDLVAGDPRRGHPVAGFGRAAAVVERALWCDRRWRGAVHTASCVGAVVLAARAAERGPARRGAGLAPRAGTALREVLVTASVAWTVLGGTSLVREAQAIARALEDGDVEGARRLLPRLCGRDARRLSRAELARAVVESVAENTSDAVVGALVWGAVAGVPGLAGFRAVNTLDAMYGHKSARYRRFGWAAARLDDVAGWPGARLTAALVVVAGGHPLATWRGWRRDGPLHPSPNAGPVEAAFAGALGIRLGGPLAYAGRAEHRAVLNGRARAADVPDIERAVRLSRRVSALALLTTLAARPLAARLFTARPLTASLPTASLPTASLPTASLRRPEVNR